MRARVALVPCLLLVAWSAVAAPSLAERAPRGKDLYLHLDFDRLAGSPHMVGMLRFLAGSLSVPGFALGQDAASPLAFGRSVHQGLVVVDGGKARLALFAGAVEATTLKAHLQGMAAADEKRAQALTEQARAAETEAARREGRKPAPIKAMEPRYRFAEATLGGRPAMLLPSGSWLLLAADGLAAAGARADLEQALPVLQGQGAAVATDDDYRRYAKLADKSRPVWWVHVLGASTRERMLKKDQAAVASVQGSAGSADLADAVTLDSEAVCSDEPNAKAFAAQARSRLEEVRGKFLVRTLGVAGYLEGAQVEARGSSVFVHHTLTRSQATTLLNVGGQLIGLFR
jgi:hypothetical protein